MFTMSCCFIYIIIFKEYTPNDVELLKNEISSMFKLTDGESAFQ